MNSEAKTEASWLSDPVGEHQADSRTPVFASLRQSATLEFHASVQLLAERARFLTGVAGVAVALDQGGGQFVYCAATGSSVPEIGATADITRYPLRKCIKTGQVVRLTIEHLSIEASGEGPHPALAVPVLKDEKVVGFFELAPGEAAFEEGDVEAIARLSVMVSTALDHLDAAEHTENLIAEAKLEEPAPPAGPVLWHAPEPDAWQPTPDESSHSPAPADVHACTACGFPVSGRRTLCLDCEEHQDDPKSDPQADPSPAAEMFATEPPESWISAHGYTIASLLVTALAAAIILWLR
jgi:hypothetical protein